MLLLAHTAATLLMLGVIWTVQLVHYPLFTHVGLDAFPHYHARHVGAITWVVGPAMLVELGTGFLLLLQGPERIPSGAWLLGLALLGVAWGTTACASVPMHNKLAAGFDAHAHTLLVSTNWARTLAWSLRAALVLWIMGQLLET